MLSDSKKTAESSALKGKCSGKLITDNYCAMLTSGYLLASASKEENQIRIWELDAKKENWSLIRTLEHSSTYPIRCLQLLADGRLASVAADATICAWKIWSTACTHSHLGFTGEDRPPADAQIELSPMGIVTVSSKNGTKTYDCSAGLGLTLLPAYKKAVASSMSASASVAATTTAASAKP